MGEWYDYKINFANSDARLSDILVEKGLAERVNKVNLRGEPFTDFNLILDKFTYAKNKEGLPIFSNFKDKDGNPLKTISIGERLDGSLYYVNKWVPDDRIEMAISGELDDVLFIQRDYTGGRDYIAWYEKKNEIVTKNGELAPVSILGLNPNLVKETADGYKVSLPIGSESSKWGVINVPKKNVTYFEASTQNGGVYKCEYSLFFNSETIPVKFKNEEIVMNVKDMAEKYYNAIKEYREDVQKEYFIELPKDKFEKRFNSRDNSEYYIVNVPCTSSMSDNQNLSITVADYYVRKADDDTYIAYLGQKLTERNAYVEKDGEKIKTRLNSFDIVKDFKEKLLTCSNRDFSRDILEQSHAKNEDFYNLEQVIDDEEMER